jgi:peptide deformylase
MKVVTVPDNRLRVKTKPVKKITPELIKVFDQMVNLTLSFEDPEGVGLAATQIGENEQYFVAKKTDGSFITCVNPKITKYSPKTKVYLEGCLSIPDVYGNVERHLWVEVEYLDRKGIKHKERLTGILAWIFQHETDHLAGKLFVDHVVESGSKLYQVNGRDATGGEILEEVELSLGNDK